MNLSEITLRRFLPAAIAFILFFVVSATYFSPQFRGEKLPQHDVLQYEGMNSDIKQMRSETGEDPQWTGNMFGGMPAYLINVAYPAQLVKNTVGEIIRLVATPAGFLFFAMSAMWLMLLIFGVNPWIGIIASLAYGLSTYFVLIIGAGHITKMWALVYAPLMMGGVWMTLRRNLWCGAALTALATSLEVGTNHPQIAYYFGMAMAALWISEAVIAVRDKRLRDFALRTVVLIAAGLIAIASNFSPLWYTMQHSKETIRGGSELAVADEKPRSGLDLEYATAWSYGPTETFNLLIPDFMGRESASTFPADGATAAVLNDYGLRGAAQQLPTYWGDQPYTGGPTYLGAAAVFLAVLGLFLLRGRDKWWLLGICLLMMFLSWGRHWMGFTEFFFDYLPGYNKFRTVSMALIVVQWAVPLLGALGLMRLWKGEISRKELQRALAWSVGLTGGLCLLFALFGGTLFDFGQRASSDMMIDQFQQIFRANNLQTYLDRGLDVEWGEAVGAAMATDRIAMMSADAWRSLLMILLAAGGVALFIWQRIGGKILVAILAVIMLIDLIPVDLRFLSHDNFVPARQQRITATAADKAILADKDLGFRVLNLTVSPFNDATTSYFHRSVGGYHGAKLARYQDLIDRYLIAPHPAILDMLNTRYLIVPNTDGVPQVQRRGTEYGAAWFVDNIAYADSPQQEIGLLDTVNLRTTAVVAAKDRGCMDTPVAQSDSATIRLVAYHPNYLKYEYTADEPRIAVFSEIFYDKGWTAYVDGKENSYFRADYVLRAMQLPAGKHVVEWKFRAPHWRMAETITAVASLLVLLGAIVAVIYCIRKKKSEIQ
ncbi:MAG: hypothetical protein E7148_02300 [Rikenellaceae bacterium]|nr:hypothetical protein [Rikenellaceae bacterium]